MYKDHVMSDLRPYLCTFEDCTSGTETCASHELLIKDVFRRHDWHTDCCPFCRENLPVAVFERRKG